MKISNTKFNSIFVLAFSLLAYWKTQSWLSNEIQIFKKWMILLEYYELCSYLFCFDFLRFFWCWKIQIFISVSIHHNKMRTVFAVLAILCLCTVLSKSIHLWWLVIVGFCRRFPRWRDEHGPCSFPLLQWNLLRMYPWIRWLETSLLLWFSLF